MRAHVPILVEESVIKNAGITPDADAKSTAGWEARPRAARQGPPLGEVSTERLSVFEDFFGKFDMDKLDQDKAKGEDKDTDEAPGPGETRLGHQARQT